MATSIIDGNLYALSHCDLLW